MWFKLACAREVGLEVEEWGKEIMWGKEERKAETGGGLCDATCSAQNPVAFHTGHVCSDTQQHHLLVLGLSVAQTLVLFLSIERK